VTKNFKALGIAFALPGLLAACGGGGSATSQMQPITPPPLVSPPSSPADNSGPASTAIADLIAFADAGRTTRMQFRDNTANGWARTSNCDGDACVTVDRVPGASGAGLVIYQNGTDVFVYDVFGEELAEMTAPTGIYNGLLTANYRVGADGDWVATVGEMNLWLDMAEGTVAIGGILPYTSPNGEARSSIQFFGDADLVAGEFTDPDLRVLVNSGNPSFFETTATTSGMLAAGDDGAAILGTITSTGNPDLLLLEGGYVAMHDPRY
jgi:hypothetical protein